MSAATVVTTAGCFGDDSREFRDPVAGYRWVDGQVQITTWGTCRRVRTVVGEIEGEQFNVTLGRWRATTRRGPRSLDGWTHGQAPPGFRAKAPKGVSVDSPRARELWITINPGPQQRVDHVDLVALKEQSADHTSTATWYVGEHGWLTEDELRAMADEEPFLVPLCP